MSDLPFYTGLGQCPGEMGIGSGAGLGHIPVVLVLDTGPVHTSKLTLAALEERTHWLTVEWLPRYAPELNDIETAWKGIKQTASYARKLVMV